jgi:aryl-phospho-beta-D-glucosidase BglC (GH1 family)
MFETHGGGLAMVRRAALVAGLVLAPASAGATGFSTSGVSILDPAGQPFVVSAINWYGAETRIFVPHGLWSQNYTTLLDKAKALGFSTIRLPFADETWHVCRSRTRPGRRIPSRRRTTSAAVRRVRARRRATSSRSS